MYFARNFSYNMVRLLIILSLILRGKGQQQPMCVASCLCHQGKSFNFTGIALDNGAEVVPVDRGFTTICWLLQVSAPPEYSILTGRTAGRLPTYVMEHVQVQWKESTPSVYVFAPMTIAPLYCAVRLRLHRSETVKPITWHQTAGKRCVVTGRTLRSDFPFVYRKKKHFYTLTWPGGPMFVI